MAKVWHENVIPAKAETYWELNNDPQFEAFQRPHLRLNRYEELIREERGGELYRRILVEPDLKLPGPIEKVVRRQIGDQPITYEEERWIPMEQSGDQLSYAWQIHPPALQDRLTIKGRFIVVPVNDESCRRILDAQIDVSVFGIGGLIERFASSEIKKTYERVPPVVEQWLAREG